MQTKEAILYVLNSARYVTNSYLSDLSDHDLLVRTTPGAHHIAWQLGHLLISEAFMASSLKQSAGIALTAGFLERHSAENSRINPDLNLAQGLDPFCSKAEYLELRNQQRERTLELIHEISNEELSAPGPEKMRSYAPTKGTVLLAIGTHEMMHSGQWAVVRRVLGKGIVV
jgi:hypothetical protein